MSLSTWEREVTDNLEITCNGVNPCSLSYTKRILYLSDSCLTALFPSQECLDIDECVEVANACTANSVCINTVVSIKAFI